MSKSLDTLLPAPRAAALRALERLKAAGVQCVVTDAYRTAAEQAALYAQGRESLGGVNAKRSAAGMPPLPPADNGYCVTRCNGIQVALGGTGRSAHQLGKALDVVPDLDPSERERPAWPPLADPRWGVIAAAFEAEGFEWGGRWADMPDAPHYEYKGPL
jgi:hypothetical protein